MKVIEPRQPALVLIKELCTAITTAQSSSVTSHACMPAIEAVHALRTQLAVQMEKLNSH